MKKQPKQNADATANYWSKRLGAVDPLAAVLTYNAPRAINQAYDRWERASLSANLPSLEKKRALDLACGIGRITVELAKAGANVTAVDISAAMLAACRARARRAGVSGRVTSIESPVHRLPGDLGQFDIITCFGLLEHLTPSQRRACLASAFAGLKKTGRMFIVVNNTACAFLKKRRGEKSKRFDGYCVSLVGLLWLEEFCTARGMTLSLLAANPFYAWLHYGILAEKCLSDREISRLARQVCDLDLAFPLHGPLPLDLASHFLVEVKRRSGR